MFIPITPPPPPSKNALELGQKISELIQIYQENNRNISMTDIRQAVKIAERDAQAKLGGLSFKIKILILVLLVNMLIGIGCFFLLSHSGGSAAKLSNYLILGLITIFCMFCCFMVVVKKR